MNKKQQIKQYKKLKPYKAVCSKCGEVYLTDQEVKNGAMALCEKCV